MTGTIIQDMMTTSKDETLPGWVRQRIEDWAKELSLQPSVLFVPLYKKELTWIFSALCFYKADHFKYLNESSQEEVRTLLNKILIERNKKG